MSDRRFRLAGLLRVRKLQEEQAAAELGRAVGSREQARARAAQAGQELSGHNTPTNVDIATWRAVLAARTALHQNVLLATAAVDTAQRAVTEREDEWQAARVRAVPLEKLEEKHDERMAEEDLHTEQLELDEAATRRATTPSSTETLKEQR